MFKSGTLMYVNCLLSDLPVQEASLLSLSINLFVKLIIVWNLVLKQIGFTSFIHAL